MVFCEISKESENNSYVWGVLILTIAKELWKWHKILLLFVERIQ